MKKFVLFLVMLLAFSQAVFSADPAQYEYMVVSFGKALFSSTRSKTMAYWDEGISKNAMGATSYEDDLDILGKHGWEVVSVTGTIGGDQQVMLKRLMDDPARTASEEDSIDKNSEKVIEGLLDSLIAKDAEKKDAGLVDLDAQEAKAAIQSKRASFEASASKYINSQGRKPVNIEYSWDSKKEKVSIYVRYDLTNDCLIKPNQYRRSSAIKLLDQIASMMTAIPEAKNKLNYLTANGTITYKEKNETVGSVSYYYDYDGKWEQLSAF